MKVTLERLPESRVQLDIEVDDERLERSLDVAYRKIASKSKIPGFRPGKAPRSVVERMVGRDGLIREALDKLVPDVYNEAIESEDVSAIAQPELEILEFEPVRFKAIVAVRPTVDLGDYRAVRVEREPVEVTEEQVDEQIQLLRKRNAMQSPVERGAQWGDTITADVKGETEDRVFLNDTAAEIAMVEERVLLVPGLSEAIVGMKKGEEKDIELEVPEDSELAGLAGKQVTFHVAVSEVKEEILPEEDDDLAGLINAEEFPTLEALRQRFRDDIEKNMIAQAESKQRDEAIEKILEGASVDYPSVLVDREIDHIIQDNLGGDRQQYQTYLQRVGRSEAEFRETFREPAEARVKRSLVLSQLAEDEGIEVEDEDVEAELDTLTASMGDDAARFRDLFSGADNRESIRRNLFTRKTLERLSAIASGEADPKEEPA